MMIMISAFFTRLSLNAEKNWHQKIGANRRVDINELNMGSSPAARSRGGVRVKIPLRGPHFELRWLIIS